MVTNTASGSLLTASRSPFRHRKVHRQRGFSLIELVVAVAIVGVLASIATSGYANYAIKANRAAAATFLYSVASRQEQYLLDAHSYAATVAELGVSVPDEVNSQYAVEIDADNEATPPAFEVTATPRAGTRQAEDPCAAITLEGSGGETVSGTAAVSTCWSH